MRDDDDACQRKEKRRKGDEMRDESGERIEMRDEVPDGDQDRGRKGETLSLHVEVQADTTYNIQCIASTLTSTGQLHTVAYTVIHHHSTTRR